MDSTRSFRAITWNVHRGRGHNDRQGVDPERLHKALAQDIAPLAPHVLALQEADAETAPYPAILDARAIADRLELIHATAAPSMRSSPQASGFCGSVFFLHPGFEVRHEQVLDLPGHCHRGAVVIEAVWENLAVRLISVHLSRLEILRLAQMRTLGQFIMRRPQMQTVLLGDINDWRYWRGPAFARKVLGTRLVGPSRPTFPVNNPFLPLDRILTDAPGCVEDVSVLDSPTLRLASDHRALSAQVRLG